MIEADSLAPQFVDHLLCVSARELLADLLGTPVRRRDVLVPRVALRSLDRMSIQCHDDGLPTREPTRAASARSGLARVTPRSKSVRRRLLAMRMVGETVHIRNIETLVQSKKGKLMSVSYAQRRRDGEQQRRKREIYDSGNSAVILPYDSARNMVLLTRQLRLPIFLQDGKGNALEACAGKLDGAAAEERIRKEIEEELGYRIVEVERLFELYVNPASIMEKVFFFTCSYSPAQKISGGGGLKEEGEDIEVVEITLENAANMVATREIIDAKTVVLIQYLNASGPRKASDRRVDVGRRGSSVRLPR